MENKNRLLLVLKYLWEKTDEDHAVGIQELTEYLEQNGITVTRKTLTADIHDLRDAGIDIVWNRGSRNNYYIASRGFDFTEIKFLVDAVEASHFLSRSKTNQLISELQLLVSESQRKELKKRLDSETKKAKNEQVLINVDKLLTAMREKKQVKFHLRRYTLSKEAGLANYGEYYFFSPYKLLYTDEKYYVVGYSEKHGGIGQFRVDRMVELKDAMRPARKMPSQEELQAHIDGMFAMYNGTPCEVELECDAAMMDYVIDRFGDDIETTEIDAKHFSLKTKVELSASFFGWVMGFGGQIRVKGPEEAVKEFRKLRNRFD